MMDEQAPRPRVAVIGGGISGLSAAHRLLELNSECDIHLFEADSRLGGVLQTSKTDDGYLLENSADNFITNIPYALDLCRRLGMEEELLPTNEALRKAYVVRNGKLFPVPDGFVLMAPSKMWSVITTPILSWAGKLRLAKEYFVPIREETSDECLESFVTRRLGKEAYERLVQPLIGGIYTADPTKLSIQATLRQFVEMEQKHGSLIKAAQRKEAAGKKNESGARYSMFVAPKQGMGDVIQRLQERLSGQAIHLNTPVSAVEKTDDHWTVQTPDEKYAFDAVIMALPAPHASKVLGAFPVLTENLAAIPYAGCSVAILAVDEKQIGRPVAGFGFVVPEIENRKILAGSFSSAKFPGRAPEGKVIIRVFVGGACHPELADLSDDEMKQVVMKELGELIGLNGEPEKFLVTRWMGKMPQYHLGHLDRVATLEEEAARLPGFELAGNAYRGVGVPQCIQSGEQAAKRVLDYLSSR
ncbi:protoporphyrinogen oxidase [Bremerella sp. P1]|uniref:protoporphyrinogen oxidase n=1 Tax=Bremerella sp. P1 TaxID=3026424 RepID=UPI0023675843|nr:protoporphyrinogen oxidase [Bremerella sp. P1]WDI40716.1 protoporphyrinogen oxidase [Bremerella sp. P1]